jgi:hypothetical protein
MWTNQSLYDGLRWASLFLVFCLVLFGASGTLQAQEPPSSASSLPLPKSEPNTPPQKASSASSWQTLLESWASLKQELTASEQDWRTLLTLLHELQTEQYALRSLLTQLTEHYGSLVSTWETDRAGLVQSAALDRERADQSDKKAQFLTITTISSAAVAIIAIIIAVLR